MALNMRQIEKWRRRLFSRAPLIGDWTRRRTVQALVQEGSPSAIRLLAEAMIESDDEELRSLTLEALSEVEDQESVDQICEVWAERRREEGSIRSSPGYNALVTLMQEEGWIASAPPTLRLLTALQIGNLEAIMEVSDTIFAEPLVEACEDPDPLIARRARGVLGTIQDQEIGAAICDTLASRWAKSRSSTLATLLVREKCVAREPLEIRVLSALKSQQREPVTQVGPEAVPFVAAACLDEDEIVAREARLALREFTDRRAQDAVCRLFIQQDMRLAKEAALTADYVPIDAVQRALFFFLTGQWERYDELDFDRNLLRIAYSAADAALARRIREQMKTSGRIDFLVAVAGEDVEVRAMEMTASEAELLVQMLTGRHAWERLWELASLLHFDWSVRIIRTLQAQGWQPEEPTARRLFAGLVQLVSTESLQSSDLLPYFPPALRRATLRVPVEINDVAFAPDAPSLAIATGQQRLVVWDFQWAMRQNVYEGFQHALGYVRFSGEGRVLCTERTSDIHMPCGVFVTGDEQKRMRRVGEHIGSITALEPVGEEHFFTTGRDFRAVLWSPEGRVNVHNVQYWARAAQVDPRSERLVLLSRVLTLLSLPDFDEIAQGWSGASMGHCMAFTPDGETLVVGKYNGEVVICRFKKDQVLAETAPLVLHKERVEGVEILSGEVPVVVSASSTGEVAFTNLEERTSLGHMDLQDVSLGSLHVSPDGAFMALEESSTLLSLWDLRALSFPVLLTQPLAAATPADLAAITALAGAPEFPSQVRQSLRYIEQLLRYRFREHMPDIQEIQMGEFELEK